jgi:NDP-sugar pyrophosphorylase family protein
MTTNIVNLRSARSVKEFIETANEQIMTLTNALYEILDSKNLDHIKEIAAEALDEDLEEYLAEDDLEMRELDFEDDDKLPWDDIEDER